MAQQRAGVRTGPRSTTGATTGVRPCGAALVLRRSHSPAHAAVFRRNGLVCVLACRATPFALNHTTHGPLPNTPEMQHMVTVAARPHLVKLLDPVAADQAFQRALIQLLSETFTLGHLFVRLIKIVFTFRPSRTGSIIRLRHPISFSVFPFPFSIFSFPLSIISFSVSEFPLHCSLSVPVFPF